MQAEACVPLILGFAIRPECVIDCTASMFLLSQLANVSLKYN